MSAQHRYAEECTTEADFWYEESAKWKERADMWKVTMHMSLEQQKEEADRLQSRIDVLERHVEHLTKARERTHGFESRSTPPSRRSDDKEKGL